MKHNRFHQIFSVAMAVLVFFSTLSVSIEKHYCGAHLVDVAIFSEAESCGMEMADMDLSTSNEGPSISKKTCCTDVLDLLEGQDELSVEKTQVLKTDQKVFLMAFTAVFNGLIPLETQKSPPFEHYSPPLLAKDIQVLHEVFLI